MESNACLFFMYAFAGWHTLHMSWLSSSYFTPIIPHFGLSEPKYDIILRHALFDQLVCYFSICIIVLYPNGAVSLYIKVQESIILTVHIVPTN